MVSSRASYYVCSLLKSVVLKVTEFVEDVATVKTLEDVLVRSRSASVVFCALKLHEIS